MYVFRKPHLVFMKNIFPLKKYCGVRLGLTLMKLTCLLSCKICFACLLGHVRSQFSQIRVSTSMWMGEQVQAFNVL